MAETKAWAVESNVGKLLLVFPGDTWQAEEAAAAYAQHMNNTCDGYFRHFRVTITEDTK